MKKIYSVKVTCASNVKILRCYT